MTLLENYQSSTNNTNKINILSNSLTIKNSFSGILFLDRDGVLLEDPGYLSSPSEVYMLKGANRLLELATNANFAKVIITNQSGIGRGYYNWYDYQMVTDYYLNKLTITNIPDLILASGHHPNDTEDICSDWRKPLTGMITYSLSKLLIEQPLKSLLIGDKLTDLQAGLNSSIKRLIHVKTGHGILNCKHVHAWACLNNINVDYYDSIRDIPDLFSTFL